MICIDSYQNTSLEHLQVNVECRKIRHFSSCMQPAQEDDNSREMHVWQLRRGHVGAQVQKEEDKYSY